MEEESIAPLAEDKVAEDREPTEIEAEVEGDGVNQGDGSEEEHQRQAKEEARQAGEPTLLELREEIRALRLLLEQRPQVRGGPVE